MKQTNKQTLEQRRISKMNFEQRIRKIYGRSINPTKLSPQVKAILGIN